jgi:hypothetical protein
MQLTRRDARKDAIHKQLATLIEIPTTSYLWVPADAVTFTPRVLPIIYGDGRALFTIGTLNQRPRYWVIRGDSRWTTYGDSIPYDEAPEPVEFVELIDYILPDMEERFGRAQCGYCGQSLSMYSADDLPHCDRESCDAADTLEAGCDWPAVDDNGGCHWSRMDWPADIAAIENPWAWRGNLLAESVDA